MSENEFLRQVLHLARLFGWRTAHFRPAITRRGKWLTAVQGNGKGFPDLVLVKGKRLIFAELKSRIGKLTAEQKLWLEALREAGIRVEVWKPADWPLIEAILRGDMEVLAK